MRASSRKESERARDRTRGRGTESKASGRRRAAAPEPPARVASREAAHAAADRKVLEAFRRFLMKPGQMLCFASGDAAAMRDSLGRLTKAGMLVAEKFPGAYSLTHAGFAMMESQK